MVCMNRQSNSAAGSVVITADTNFIWPDSNIIVVELWGGGAGGMWFNGANAWTAGSGGSTKFDTTAIVATGGVSYYTNVAGSGGDSFLPGEQGTGTYGGAPGNPSGGIGGARMTTFAAPGNSYGGGGSGSELNIKGGNGGEYRIKTYTGNAYALGASIPVTIGVAGTRGTDGSSYVNNPGAAGAARITWF